MSCSHTLIHTYITCRHTHWQTERHRPYIHPFQTDRREMLFTQYSHIITICRYLYMYTCLPDIHQHVLFKQNIKVHTMYSGAKSPSHIVHSNYKRYFNQYEMFHMQNRDLNTTYNCRQCQPLFDWTISKGNMSFSTLPWGIQKKDGRSRFFLVCIVYMPCIFISTMLYMICLVLCGIYTICSIDSIC